MGVLRKTPMGEAEYPVLGNSNTLSHVTTQQQYHIIRDNRELGIIENRM